jgi:hypothetical protein
MGIGQSTLQKETKEKIEEEKMEADRIIETLQWMVADMTHRHDECGNPGNYSPELSRAIEILDDLQPYRGGVVMTQRQIEHLMRSRN